jgi:hypothetical protein
LNDPSFQLGNLDSERILESWGSSANVILAKSHYEYFNFILEFDTFTF